MNLKHIIKDNASQILAITEKNIKLTLRYKLTLVFSFIVPIISILMPIIILNSFFNLDENINFGPWNKENFYIFQITAYNITLLTKIVVEIPNHLRLEKFWQTLPGLIIAPFNRINLLLGIFLGHLVVISIPFVMFIIIGFIFFPISFYTLMFILFIYMLLALVFSGIGLLIGIFAISNENIWRLLSFGFIIILWFTCITYPFEMFPGIVKDFIRLNPLYYLIDFLRIAWLNDNVILTISLYPINFILIICLALFIPYLGVIIFNKVYRKFGIVG